MRSDFFHRSLYDLVALGSLFSGLTLALLVGFVNRPTKRANLFLSLALGVIVLKTGGLSAAFLPALGPLLFFYTQHLTRPQWRFQRTDWLHFWPLLVGWWMPVWLVIISVTLYLFRSHRLIQEFYKRLQPVLMDRPCFAFRGLDKALVLLGYSCLVTLVSDWFFLAMALVLMGMAVDVIFQSDNPLKLEMPSADRSDAKRKGRKLKEAVAANHLYQDAELTLTTLAVKLGIHPHELSRIINVGLEKNFSDFINEFRVREVARKMRDPAYDRLTLLGIAYESGFNAKTTFNRVFKQMTGQTPVDYKNSVKKEVPIHQLAPVSPIQSLVLRSESPPTPATDLSNRTITYLHTGMLHNYLKIAWRSLINNKGYSAINISGLAVGMAVAITIGLWVWDELSFNHYFDNYDRIVQVAQHGTANGETWTGSNLPLPLGAELKTQYPSDFKRVLKAWHIQDHLLTVGTDQFSLTGQFIESQVPDMLTLHMLKGTRSALREPNSILLSASAANLLFGEADPMNKVVKINNGMDAKVTGVYADMPANTEFHQVQFFAPWDLFVSANPWIKQQGWGNNFIQVWAELQPHVDVDQVSAKIRDIKVKYLGDNKEQLAYHFQIFLHPMSKWHLYSGFDKQGANTGGLIEYVWLFGLIGAFVLLLACINFMNLSTARSEDRAKEVGIRKAVGSLRGQLIGQFFSESFLVVLLAFLLALFLVVIWLDWFNALADKQMTILWANPYFWLMGLSFVLVTGLLAGSYPALYLSSFQPLKALKGTFRVGRLAALPRKVLVVVQFTVSVTLIIGTILVYRQIQYAKNRPVGYSRQGLLQVHMATNDFYTKYDALRQQLLNSGVVLETAQSASQATELWSNNSGFDWPGKAPSQQSDFGTLTVSTEYGKTVGWQFIAGRDFSRDFASDSAAFVVNQAAVRYMGLKHPVGETIRRDGVAYRIIGVIQDMVMGSPFEPVYPTVFFLRGPLNWINIKLKPNVAARDALPKLEAIFKKVIPSVPFDYDFVEQRYAAKFADEDRIGKLAALFASLAIFISCLGLFGLASFVAEQRTKEIGVRKVLGASVFSLWQLLSKDFLQLVGIAIVMATPTAWYFLDGWIKNYTYRTDLSWWIFAAAGLGALLITLLTVSYQTLKAALVNPVKSLRNE